MKCAGQEMAISHHVTHSPACCSTGRSRALLTAGTVLVLPLAMFDQVQSKKPLAEAARQAIETLRLLLQSD